MTPSSLRPTQLQNLRPGTRFRTSSGLTGTLLYANPCRAHVQVDAPAKQVAFRDRSGKARRFTVAGGRRINLPPELVVEVLAQGGGR